MPTDWLKSTGGRSAPLRLPRHVLTVAFLAVAGVALRAGQQPPTFKSEIAIVRLDVSVVGSDGLPVGDLTPTEFDVSIAGKPEPVVSLQYVSYWSDPGIAPTTEATSFASNTRPVGRLTVVVVDEAHLVPGQERAFLTGLQQFFEHTRPEDRTALISLPGGSARVDFTNDVKALQSAVTRLHAWPSSAPDLQRLTLSQKEPDAPMFGSDKQGRVGPDDLNPVVDTLSAIADSLRDVEGPKTLVLVTAKLPGQIKQIPVYQEFAKHAASARLNVYAIRQQAVPSDVISTSTNTGRIKDEVLDGLDILAGATGGTTIDGIARATGAFDRIDRETRGSYVLAVQLPPGTNPNKPIEATIHVRRPGVTVRGPKQLVPALQFGEAKKGPRDRLHLMLGQPRPATEVPLFVTAYAGRGTSGLKTIVLAEIPERAFTRPLQWGYEVRQGNKVVFGQMQRTEGPAAGEGIEPLSIVSAPDVVGGEYHLRFAVIDAEGRRGSVDYPLHVRLTDAGDCELSDVFVGEEIGGHFHPRISVDPRIKQIAVSVDVYPKRSISQLENKKVQLVVLDGAGQQRDGIVLPPSTSGDKGIVQAVFPIRGFGAGTYQVCARMTAQDQSTGDQVCQSFRVTPSE